MTVLFRSTSALLTGFILDAIFGDPHRFPHIVRAMGKLIALSEKNLRLLLPESPRGERLGGTLIVCFVTLLCTCLPFFILFICYRHIPVLGFALESFLCYQLLAARSLKMESMKVYHSLCGGDIEAARENISMIVGRDTAKLDNDGVIRAAVETVSENASDGVVAPLFYMVFGGASLGCLYKAVNTMDSMIGYKNDKYLNFGRAAAKTDDVLNYIPSRICALFMVVSAFLLRLDGKSAFRVWRRDGRKHASPNSAQTEAVCAGALGVRLAGQSSYNGTVIDKQYIGDDTRPIQAGDIVSANRLMYVASVLMLLFALAVRVIIYAYFFL